MNGGAGAVCLNSKLFNLHHIILYFIPCFNVVRPYHNQTPPNRFQHNSMSLNEYFVRNQSLTRPFLK